MISLLKTSVNLIPGIKQPFRNVFCKNILLLKFTLIGLRKASEVGGSGGGSGVMTEVRAHAHVVLTFLLIQKSLGISKKKIKNPHHFGKLVHLSCLFQVFWCPSHLK